ncbi:hypothetical protein QPI79_002237 [Enterococcus faecalis]|nr:hypothetical protein [Enterococcus faecalis]
MNKTKFEQFGAFELEFDEKDLKGTPFYVKRNSITSKQLRMKPVYRTFKLLRRIAKKHDVIEYLDFEHWVQMPIDDYDEQFDFVKRFRNSYGKFKACRYLLTVENAVKLYIETH